MAQFPGYGGPVGTEVIGQLGPGHGDGEGRAASLFGLEGKVRQQFLAQRFFGNDFELFQELGILIGHEAEHVFNELKMEGAGIGTDMQDLVEGQDQEFRVLYGLEGHDGLKYRTTDKGFAKEAAAADDGQDGLVAPAVFVDHVDFSAEDDADIAHFILSQDQKFAFADGPDPRTQAGEHGHALVGADAGKEGEVIGQDG